MKRLAVMGFMVCVLITCAKEPQSVEEFAEAGERAFLDQEYGLARKYLSKVIAQRPSDRHVLYLLGISYARDFLYDSAFHYLKRLDILYPGDRETNLELYRIAPALNEWKAAVQAINSLVETGDSLGQYYEDLAQLNLFLENYRVALHYFRKLREQDPDNRNYHLQVANLSAQLDFLEEALSIVDSALARFGPTDEFLLNKATYLTALRRYDEAETILRPLLAKDTASVPYRLNLANTLSSQDERSKKEEAYRLYLQIDTLLGEEFRVDSMVSALREELKLDKDTK